MGRWPIRKQTYQEDISLRSGPIRLLTTPKTNQQVMRQRRVKIIRDLEAITINTQKAPKLLGRGNRNDSRDGHTSVGYDHFSSRGNALQQGRKMGLRLMDIDFLHGKLCTLRHNILSLDDYSI